MIAFRRLALISVAAVACLSAAAVFVSAAGPADETPVPAPDARAAVYCRALHRDLPHSVNGLGVHDLRPASDFTAGWGDPAIVLRCGVPRPQAMSDSSADSVEVDGVGWLIQAQGDGSFKLTTTLRKAYVEVTLPKKYAGDVGPLTDLAGAVRKTIPNEL